MTTTSAPTRAHTSRVWGRVQAWVVRPDNARTDFAVIGLFNAGIGAVLATVPALAHSPSLSVLMSLLPRAAWAGWFLGTGVLVLAGLRCRAAVWAGRLRHYAWAGAGTGLVMWMVGVLWATGSLTSVLALSALLAWYTLTAARLELPRFLAHTLG